MGFQQGFAEGCGPTLNITHNTRIGGVRSLYWDMISIQGWVEEEADYKCFQASSCQVVAKKAPATPCHTGDLLRSPGQL